MTLDCRRISAFFCVCSQLGFFACVHTSPSVDTRVRTTATTSEYPNANTDDVSNDGVANHACDVRTDLLQRQHDLTQLRVAWQKQARDVATVARFSRCTFAVAELSQEADTIKALCNEGMQSIRILDDQHVAELDYLYALNLGLLMQVDMLSALGRVPELQQRLEHAMQQAQLDQGGPLRVLGMLYLQAPPWPSSIGDVDRAVELLAQAAHDYPDYPHNHIFYAQALLEAGRPLDAENALKNAELALAQSDWGAATQRWSLEIEPLRQKLKSR